LNKALTILLLLAPLPLLLSAQNQLVLIKNDRVVIRYKAGDDFVYKRKSRKDRSTGFIVEINDSTIITSNDTVATHQPQRIYFRKGNFLNVVGGFFTACGGGLFVLDQINNGVVRGNEVSLDDNVSRITLTSLAIGVPLMMLVKRSHRVGFRQRLKIVNRTSPFYYSESRLTPRGRTPAFKTP
jgi:hypothetical protein